MLPFTRQGTLDQLLNLRTCLLICKMEIMMFPSKSELKEKTSGHV